MKKVLSIVLALAMVCSLFVFAPVANAAEVSETVNKLVQELDFDTVSPLTARNSLKGVSYTAVLNGLDADCYLYAEAKGKDESLEIGEFLMKLVANDFQVEYGAQYDIAFDYYLLEKPATGMALSVEIGGTGAQVINAADRDLFQWYTHAYSVTGNGGRAVDVSLKNGTVVLFDNIKIMQGESEIARLTFDSESYTAISGFNSAFKRMTADDVKALFASDSYLHIDATQLTNPLPFKITFDGLSDVDFGEEAAIFMSCDITVDRQADPDAAGNKNDLNFRVMDVNGGDALSTTGGNLWDWMWFEDCGPDSQKPLLDNEFELGVPNHMVKQFGIPVERVKGLTIWVYPGFIGSIDNIKIYRMNIATEVASYDFDHPGGHFDDNGNSSMVAIATKGGKYANHSNGTNGVLDIDSNVPDGQNDTYYTFPKDFGGKVLKYATEYMVSFDYMNARDNNKNDWCFAVIVGGKYNEPNVYSTTDEDSSYTEKECPVGRWQHTTVRFTTEVNDGKFQLQVSGDGEVLFDNFKIYEMNVTAEPSLTASVRSEDGAQYVDVTYTSNRDANEFDYNLLFDTENLTYQDTALAANIEGLDVEQAGAAVVSNYHYIDTRSYSGPDYYHETITYQLKNGFEYNDSYNGAGDYSKATFTVMTYRVLEGTPKDSLGIWNNDPTDGAYSQVTGGTNSGSWVQLDASGAWAEAYLTCHHTPKQPDGNDNFFTLRVPTGLLIEIKSIITYDGRNAEGTVAGVADIEEVSVTEEAVPTDHRGLVFDTDYKDAPWWKYVEIPYEATGDLGYKAEYDGLNDYCETFAVMTYRVLRGNPLDKCSLANNCGFEADGYTLAEGNNTGALFALNADGQIHKHGVQYHHTPKKDQNFFMVAIPKGIELEILSIKVYKGWMAHNNVYVYDDDPDNYNIGTNSPVGVADIDLIPLYGEDKLPQLIIDATEADTTKKVYFSVPDGYEFSNTTGASVSSCPNGLALHFKVRYFGTTADVNGNHFDIRLNGANYYPAQNYKKIAGNEGEWVDLYVQTHSAPPVEGQNFIEIKGFKGCKYDFKYIGVCTRWLNDAGKLDDDIPDVQYFDRQYFAGDLADPKQATTGGEGLHITCKAATKMDVFGDIATSSFRVADGFNGTLKFTVTDATGKQAEVEIDLNTSLNVSGVIARTDKDGNKTGIAFGQIVLSDDIGYYYEDESGEIVDVIDIGFLVALDKHIGEDEELTVDTVNPYVQNLSVIDCDPESVTGDEVYYNNFTVAVDGIADADEEITALPYIVIDDGNDTVIYGQHFTTSLNAATENWVIPN